ncbi:hypothetical protein [Pelagicoccus sp. SDUM812003]|uniref:hypothetical protein n=1 Tax=Pelagicoccus sp. SDUM812003 TaxID=3041267 RepID=UPI00280FE4BF|nr:hypothetical protein [Pelagicoccus sp. SDUM812003]MDQ8201497.1 hypothetical protein [Pelagicoccus sp. SDUM812003]
MSSPKNRSSSGPISSKASKEHLDPESERSRKDQVLSRTEAETERTFVVTRAYVEIDGYQYRSLGVGKAWRLDGTPYKKGEFVPDMEAKAAKRRKRKSTESRGKGKGRRTRWHDVPHPLRKETITFSGEHDYALKALDKYGYDLGPFTTKLVLSLPSRWDECDWRSMALASILHTEAGAIHSHLATTEVDDDGKKIGPPTPGNQKSPRAGEGLIGTLRLIKTGHITDPVVIAEAEASLAKKSAASGQPPPDYVLSCYVDRSTERFLKELSKDKDLARVIQEAREGYAAKHTLQKFAEALAQNVLDAQSVLKLLGGLHRTVMPLHENVKRALSEAELEESFQMKFQVMQRVLKPSADKVNEYFKEVAKKIKAAGFGEIKKEPRPTPHLPAAVEDSASNDGKSNDADKSPPAGALDPQTSPPPPSSKAKKKAKKRKRPEDKNQQDHSEPEKPKDIDDSTSFGL